jgi:hypothetical protein
LPNLARGNVAVLDAHFEYDIGRARDTVAYEIARFKLFND